LQSREHALQQNSSEKRDKEAALLTTTIYLACATQRCKQFMNEELCWYNKRVHQLPAMFLVSCMQQRLRHNKPE
jgi:hypothetical protein